MVAPLEVGFVFDWLAVEVSDGGSVGGGLVQILIILSAFARPTLHATIALSANMTTSQACKAVSCLC